MSEKLDITLHPAREANAKHRRGRLTNTVISNAIKGSLGNVSYIARKLGVSRMTVYSWIKKSKDLQRLYDEENETMLDNAENELISLMNPSVNDDPRCRLEALKFFLRCKGKGRGYVEKLEQEVTGKGGSPLLPPSIIIQPVKVKDGEN